jgi:hypothetical protein
MEVRETIHSRQEGTQVQSLNIGDKIQIIQLNRRYRNATPTTSDINKYPEGLMYDVSQEVKEITGSYEEDLSDLFADRGEDDTVTIVEFDDGSEMHAESLLDRLNEQPMRVRNELDEGYTIYEKH